MWIISQQVPLSPLLPSWACYATPLNSRDDVPSWHTNQAEAGKQELRGGERMGSIGAASAGRQVSRSKTSIARREGEHALPGYHLVHILAGQPWRHLVLLVPLFPDPSARAVRSRPLLLARFARCLAVVVLPATGTSQVAMQSMPGSASAPRTAKPVCLLCRYDVNLDLSRLIAMCRLSQDGVNWLDVTTPGALCRHVGCSSLLIMVVGIKLHSGVAPSRCSLPVVLGSLTDLIELCISA
ncbi:hypothetical protein G7046_g9878 [Stylonectria norvegica]|nr:hypothetical protein G7046_g9878 [Stylonectria norvegica]